VLHIVNIAEKLLQQVASFQQAKEFPQNVRTFSAQIRLVGNATGQDRNATNMYKKLTTKTEIR